MMKYLYIHNLLQCYRNNINPPIQLLLQLNKTWYTCYFAIILLLFGATSAYSQKNYTEFQINFRLNSIVIDSLYADNATRMREMVDSLQVLLQDSTVNILEVSLCGAASPEGNDRHNRHLAQGRLQAFETFIRNKVHLPDSIITRNDSYIPWNYLKSKVEASDMTFKEQILSILNEPFALTEYLRPGTYIDHRVLKLKQLDNGKIWNQLNNRYFKQMRNAYILLVTYKEEPKHLVQEPVLVEDTTAVVPSVVLVATDTIVPTPLPTPTPDEWKPKLHLKTNAVGLCLAMANVAFEVDLSPHWSVTLPIYFSALNYFTSTLKFRTFAVQPEIRYWWAEQNQGLFAGAHLGLAYYNFAFDGKYRYQDHNRRSPALGGGLSLGYRMPICKNGKWNVEFSLGAGCYSLHYDKFHNTPNTKDGLLVETVKKTYWGIDQVAASLSYSFDLNKKGGKR